LKSCRRACARTYSAGWPVRARYVRSADVRLTSFRQGIGPQKTRLMGPGYEPSCLRCWFMARSPHNAGCSRVSALGSRCRAQGRAFRRPSRCQAASEGDCRGRVGGRRRAEGCGGRECRGGDSCCGDDFWRLISIRGCGGSVTASLVATFDGRRHMSDGRE
jgi:hypothetical protein